jgi:hypothetical protein
VMASPSLLRPPSFSYGRRSSFSSPSMA